MCPRTISIIRRVWRRVVALDKKQVTGCILGGLVVLSAIGRIASSTSRVESTATVVASAREKWHLTETRSPMDDSRTVVLSLDFMDLLHDLPRLSSRLLACLSGLKQFVQPRIDLLDGHRNVQVS